MKTTEIKVEVQEFKIPSEQVEISKIIPVCPKCKQGFLYITEESKMNGNNDDAIFDDDTKKMLYELKCKKCGHSIFSDVPYPTLHVSLKDKDGNGINFDQFDPKFGDTPDSKGENIINHKEEQPVIQAPNK